MNFKLTQKEWYELRDDRTKRVDGAQGFENYSLGVLVSPDIHNSFEKQAMLFLVLNINSRWCKKINIQMPSAVSSLLPMDTGEDFKESLVELAKKTDPYLELSFKNIGKDEVDDILVLGNVNHNLKKRFTWIDCDGWLSGIGIGNTYKTFISRNSSANVLGACFAACMGSAQIFRNAVGIKKPKHYSSWYSLFNFGCSETNSSILTNPEYLSYINLGNIVQIGCGAVGSSFSFLLSLTGWKATVTLIDYDKVEYSNCNRSLVFTAYDAVNKNPKIDCCEKVLLESKMNIHKFYGSYSDYISQNNYLEFPPDIILNFANEQNIWSTIQENYPPLVLHSTTTKNWGVNVGRHIPKKEWCILCRFSKEIDHEFTPTCGKGEIKQNNKEHVVEGVLPFLPPLSALFILAELAKIPFKEYPINSSFVEFSAKSAKREIFQQIRRPIKNCACSDQLIEYYPNEITKSKFWNLTNC